MNPTMNPGKMGIEKRGKKVFGKGEKWLQYVFRNVIQNIS